MSLQFLGDDIIRHKFRVVMPALVAGIHVFPSEQTQDVDGRKKSGHDQP